MPDQTMTPDPAAIPPPNKHQLAVMIWLCVLPTLTILNLALGDWLKTRSASRVRSSSPPWRSRSSSTHSCHTSIGCASAS
jgi:hypothetical protein